MKQFALKCFMIVLSTWGREGFAASSQNLIQYKNSLFMHRPTFIEELYETQQILTSKNTFNRRDIEEGAIPIELFQKTYYSPQEIYRLAKETIEESENNGENLSDPQKQALVQTLFQEYSNTIDSQVMEGVALAIAPASIDKIFSAFSRLEDFKRYVPNVFLESSHLTLDQLKKRRIVKLENIEYQFSKVKIASVEFTHTLRYEITREEKPKQRITVAWEIDPLFERDREFSQKGVLMNNGLFIIEPYDAHRSIILYQVYIKVDPLNAIMRIFSDIFKESEAKAVIHALANAMRMEAQKP
ncbi:MAG: hypothetical protein A2Z91_05350 [Deltaproteobacteria bacterium GWA2_38_16]|nr:MAG: hypothetical protein A2Z91_05350 [Deltaproteobacteria bacterium GWA2_38_16]OGQ03204.1 MAG: hypothetical protein A3D19_04080 [Deltaproteobacteria bacterium RIFCSPHIGHO2_02_FULL_38_15]OGQ34661.1 MAG: hypothetical protein A3A72_00810 [Deltaproteobacteria bacterium RIFCSPLOWO2_01_FULL_38_9]OGQ59797.1 MAG: hypothetical protein A3G92_02795 [Deltaproteobacteria bacterium RIFCSPLOWO2_12_FULL_38_8]HBQ20370.1 hypothetical protein [Deltaproteobacteria bacterium]